MVVDGARHRLDAGCGSSGGTRPSGAPDDRTDQDGLDPDGPDPVARAREICLHRLAARARSRAELAAVLARQGVEPDVAAVVLDRLTEVGLIDDAAFAADVVASGRANRGLARRALAADLRRRGVDEQASAAALAAVAPEDELASARELIARRLRSMRPQPAQVQARRLTAMLARKGYPSELIARVVAEAVTGEDGVEFADAYGLDAYGLDERGTADDVDDYM